MSANPSPPPLPLASPCVRECTLDDDEYCLGCGRHVREIVAWAHMNATEQRAVLERGAHRRAKYLISEQEVTNRER